VHALEPLHGLEEQLPVAHRQIVALDQRDAEVARQEHLLEVGLVRRARREQHDARAFAGRAERLQRVEPATERRRHALHVQLRKRLREFLRHQQAVLEQVAQARRRLQPLRQHPPASFGTARDVERRRVQVHAPGGRDAVHGAQVLRMSEHQRRR
jgi:hypothetical protein